MVSPQEKKQSKSCITPHNFKFVCFFLPASGGFFYFPGEVPITGCSEEWTGNPCKTHDGWE
jgi:hypothetical protein